MDIFDDFINWLCSIFARKERTSFKSVIIGDNNISSSNIVGNKAKINGKTINIPNGCKSLVIKNNEIWIDGKKLSEEDGLLGTDKVINVHIEGSVDSVNISHCNDLSVAGNVNEIGTNSGDITIHGAVSGYVSSTSCEIHVDENCRDITTNSGDVEIEGRVSGDIQTSSGDVDITGDVSGNIQTSSGDVDISGKVEGSVNTRSGDVTHR